MNISLSLPTRGQKTEKTTTAEKFKKILEGEGVELIHASSRARLSKYHQTMSGEGEDRRIYVVDPQGYHKPYAIEESTEIFKRYEQARIIERIYVRPDQKTLSENLLKEFLRS
jgi:uncharacterized protein